VSAGFRVPWSGLAWLGLAWPGLILVIPAGAEPPAGKYVSFLACPIARDTGPVTDVCFLAEHNGEQYALVNPPDWGVPQLHHRVLVEGLVKDGPLVCGARPLEGRASVMSELAAECGTVLPYDEIVKGAAGGVFNSGSPAQRAHAEELLRRTPGEPRASIEPAILDPPPPPVPTPPFETRTLTVIYPFSSTRGSGPDMVKLRDLAAYVNIAKARHVSVTGYRAVSLLEDGSNLAEPADLARARAEKIAGILTRLGVNAKLMQVRWEETAIPGSGKEDWRNRRAEISVEP
jgi:outer membrane protein OmpA-like peptidoglycan-associated protein